MFIFVWDIIALLLCFGFPVIILSYVFSFFLRGKMAYKFYPLILMICNFLNPSNILVYFFIPGTLMALSIVFQKWWYVKLQAWAIMLTNPFMILGVSSFYVRSVLEMIIALLESQEVSLGIITNPYFPYMCFFA